MVPSQQTPAQQPASWSVWPPAVWLTCGGVRCDQCDQCGGCRAGPASPGLNPVWVPAPVPVLSSAGSQQPPTKSVVLPQLQLQLPAAVSGVWILTESLVTTWCFMVASLQTGSRWGSGTGDWRLGSSWLLKYLQLNVPGHVAAAAPVFSVLYIC